MTNTHKAALSQLFRTWQGQDPEEVKKLPGSGSDREYFRLRSEGISAIGAYNQDVRENRAFLSFTRTFLQAGLPVPEIFAESDSGTYYLLQDLGDQTLMQALQAARTGEAIPEEIMDLYKASLSALVRLQVQAGKSIDYSLCIPRDRFDRRSMMWDLNYFKYYFLRPSGIEYDEELLQNDMEEFVDWLLKAPSEYFMFRDFQARNIMIHDGKPWFIDYQGGRRGALQYDLASLLFQARANLPAASRQELLDHYLEELKKWTEVDEKAFREHFYGFVLIRLLQAMGAYGYRGLFEQKGHFLQSIPFALQTLNQVLQEHQLPVGLPYLREVLPRLSQAPALQRLAQEPSKSKTLRVTVQSFSYKKGGVPTDMSGHGGGFVFDCRALHNPGRYPEYKEITGRAPSVIRFFKENSRIDAFFEDSKKLIEPAVRRYLERGFDHLSVNFGCTGGQHRSVYCADRMAEWLRETFPVEVLLLHREQGIREFYPGGKA